MRVDPYAPIQQLKGVGPKLQATLARLGIFRNLDLLLHLPLRYQDRSETTPIGTARNGHPVLVQGRISSCQVVFGRRRSLKVAVDDDTGRIYLRFFFFSRHQQSRLEAAGYVRAYGEARLFGRELSIAHPEYEAFDTEPEPPTPSLIPIYPTTQGLSQNQLRKLIAQLMTQKWPQDPGTPYGDLLYLHRPDVEKGLEIIEEIQDRVVLDELTAYYLVMKGRALQRRQHVARSLPRSVGLGRQLLNRLGFSLTRAQARVTGEVLDDLELEVPMLRLVQGDVGSGKTIIAAFAAIRAAEQGCQTAIMAPTELLAEQHYFNFREWLEPLGIETVLLTGAQSTAQQKEHLHAIEAGVALVVIGTHALFQARVKFRDLALCIIDEQHRFGVHQRMSLQLKSDQSGQPHQLIMTATPIPRTLTMALYADMDVSIIDELPSGRQPITTHTVEADRRGDVIQVLRRVFSRGQQAYWVCTLIEDSEEIAAMSAMTLFELLQEVLPDQKISLLHGRMKAEEKNATMASFKAGEIQLLVATTVVEVGVDVPNATHMIIENAERLGLAQLHQLRGRVGRGSLASHCFLLFATPLSVAAKTRLTAMRDSQDGFYLAEEDLKLRGPGDVLGTRQSGEQSFRIADLSVHSHLLAEAMQRGERLISTTSAAETKEMRQLLLTWAPAESGHLSV